MASCLEGDKPVAIVQLDTADNGTQVEATVGDTIQVTLEENPTTGYRWAVAEINESVLTLVSTEYTPEGGGAVGSGGNQVFTFRVSGRGESPLALKLWREWEGDSSVIQRYGIRVRVE